MLVGLAGCGDDEPAPKSKPPVPTSGLSIQLIGVGTQTASLGCNPPRGNAWLAKDAASICAKLPTLLPVLERHGQVPAGKTCAQQVSGPERATILGVINGKPVQGVFNRLDSCHEADWQALKLVLGGIPGVNTTPRKLTPTEK